MSSKDYGIVCAVYIATAIVLAGGAAAVTFFCFPKKLKGEPSSKQLVAKRMSWIPWLLYWGTLKSFVQDDGSPTGFVDYFCDKKELVGFLDCRKKTAAVRPRWMRLCAIITTLMVSISLACLLGTVVYNNENCATTRTVNDCCDCQTWCGGADIGCDGCTCKSCSSGSYQCSLSQVTVDGATTTSTSFACESASVETSNKANWVTMILTLIMGKAGSIAINTTEDGSARQKLLHLVTGSVSIALIIFGALYSQHLAKESNDDQEANRRRLKAIGLTLAAGWGYEQLVGFGAVFGQFVMYSIGYYLWYRPQLEEIKSAGAATVHPHAGQGLDDSIIKTDGVEAAMGKPVALEEVTLQPPTQQQ